GKSAALDFYAVGERPGRYSLTGIGRGLPLAATRRPLERRSLLAGEKNPGTRPGPRCGGGVSGTGLPKRAGRAASLAGDVAAAAGGVALERRRGGGWGFAEVGGGDRRPAAL